MGYYVSHMIGIRTGGVFSGETDIDDMKTRISKVIAEMKGVDAEPDIGDNPSHCMSKELVAHKGSFVVLAGVFNYWSFENAEAFVKRLSVEFGTEVMHMGWDMERDTVQCQIWLDGKQIYEVDENPIGKILRHVS
jgi:hypothetical protein